MLQLLLTVIAIVAVSSSVLANDENDCFQGHEPQLRIKGCSDVIQRSPDDATAYHNRAFAYELAGDLDDAIADYSKVVALAPSNASAYANRSRAYASKGDHIHAIEDDAKARELIAKATTQLPAVTPKIGKGRKSEQQWQNRQAPVRGKKRIAKVSNKIGQKAPSGDPWAWLFGNDAGQAGGRGNRTAQ
jgi:tetratricopeptide (TPR) repeat protein